MTYGYTPAQPPQTDSKAVWALVAAIAGFVICPVVLHVTGWVLANQSLRDIEASQGRLTGDGMAKAARILSIIGLVLSVLGFLFVTVLVLAQ